MFVSNFVNRDMDDDQTPIRPRFGRGNKGLTRLKRLSLKRVAGETTRVDININTGVWTLTTLLCGSVSYTRRYPNS